MNASICGYMVVRRLCEGKNATIYLGKNEERTALLKVLSSPHPTTAEIARLHHEFEILKSVEETGAAPIPLGIELYGNCLVLVMAGAEEDISLQERIECGPVGVEEFLRFAIGAADALDRVHGQGIFHKDIKPRNLILKENGELQIINFDIASRIAVEEQEARGIAALEGTLAYMSPEQTRRMNRPVDYRTDFYSLGVTFYQMLCGETPFAGGDPVDIIHAHLAQQPQPLSVKLIGMPQPISDILGKLLSKNAEDRYKSGIGLRADLQRCLEHWEASGEIESFPLAEKDITRQLVIPQKLYGREPELAALLGAYDTVADGAAELLLVSGYSGVGKTALVNELQPHIAKRKGTFVQGKYDQFQANTPYSAIGHAFSGLIRGILSEPSEMILFWKRALSEALGENAGIISDLVPELEIILGKSPKQDALSLLESRNRFNLAFQNFLALFARAEHPLVLFLDDLQWVDLGSLDLIKTLLMHGRHLLIIGSYRDNEVGPSHPLLHAVAEIKSSRKVEELLLCPLTLEHLKLMLAETLNVSSDACQPLAASVLTKTGGNPFFAREFLHCLFREGLLAVDVGEGKWKWDLPRIKTIDVTDNVVDLMARRIKEMPEETQHVLQIAACVGNPFELVTLATACDVPLERVVLQLWPAVEDGIVLVPEQYAMFLRIAERIRIGKSSRAALRELVTDACGSFIHDRVQQAAYSMIAEGSRPLVHLKIGQLLLRRAGTETASLVVVNHLNIGRTHLWTESERAELAVLNLHAAGKAQDASAFQAASEYASVGIELLGSEAGDKYLYPVFDLYLKGGESNGQLGRFEIAAQMLDKASSLARTDEQKGHVYSVKLAQFAAQGRYADAVEYGIEALRDFGLHLPPIHDEEAIALASRGFNAAYRAHVDEHGIDSLFHLEISDDLSHTTAMSILAAMLDCAIIGLSQYSTVLTLTMVVESCRKGNSPVSAFAYVWCGLIQIGGYRKYEEAFQLGELALKLNAEKFRNKPLTGRLLMMYGGFIVGIRHPYSKCIQILELAYRECLSSGDLSYAAYAIANSCRMAILQSGLSLPACQEMIERGLERLERLNNFPMFEGVLFHKATVLNLRGLTTSIDSFDFGDFTYPDYIAKYVRASLLMSLCRLFELQRLVTFGRFLEAVAIYERTEFGPAEVYVPHIAEVRLFSVIAYAEVYEGLDTERRSVILEKIRRAGNELEAVARCNPVSYSAQERIVAAELARLENRGLEHATRCYDEAICRAKEAGLTNYAALANERAGQIWWKAGCLTIASVYLNEALRLYESWGASAKVGELQSRFPNLVQDRPQGPASWLGQDETTSDALDLIAAVNASQALSGEIHFSGLLRKMMEIVMKISGASKAVFLIRRAKELFVEAQVAMGPELQYKAEPVPADESPDIARSVVRYVERTMRTVLLNQASADPMFGDDERVRKGSVQSLMCLPVLNQRKLVAILYLENDIAGGAFIAERARIISLLSSQMAISIENAGLYANLEEKVVERTRELIAAQEQLVATAHQAGMAEIATGVLHNVGNILNHMNVSLQLIGTKLDGSSVNRMGEISAALSAKYQELLNLVENHPEGPALLDFARAFADVLAQDHEFLKAEIKRIADSIGHIGQYIRVQQNYAATEIRTGVVDLQTILENALMLEEKRLERRGIRVERLYEKVPPVSAQVNKLTHVFLNLIINAREAMSATPEEKRRLSLRLYLIESAGKSQVAVEISDTGAGIAQSQMSKIFTFGFTSKKDGHGFGLHTVANSVRDMGGEVNAKSGGIGEGATFIVRLPVSG